MCPVLLQYFAGCVFQSHPVTLSKSWMSSQPWCDYEIKAISFQTQLVLVGAMLSLVVIPMLILKFPVLPISMIARNLKNQCYVLLTLSQFLLMDRSSGNVMKAMRHVLHTELDPW